MAEELDLSSLDEMDDIDWSDVEGELQKNKEMLQEEAESNQSTDIESADGFEGGEEGVEDDFNEISADFLMDIPLHLTVEVGRSTLLVRDILALEIGSIVELKKRIGSPIHVLINDKLVAKGEIVVQNEKFGLKVTEIIEESERLEKLREL
jgi:flagellar motor switch protein FliN